MACGQEVLFEAGEIRGVIGRPLSRLGKASAPVQRCAFPAEAVPLARRGREPAVDEQAGAIGVDPALQSRPMAQQRVMRDHDRVLLDRDQPGFGEHVQHTIQRVVGPRGCRDLGTIDAPAHRLVAAPEIRQAQEDRPRDRLVAFGQAQKRVLGGLRDRSAYAARVAVSARRERCGLAVLPCLEQRMESNGSAPGWSVRSSRIVCGKPG